MASSKFHTPSALLPPPPHDPSLDYDAKGRPKKHIWGQVFLSAVLDKPLPKVPFKSKDTNALGEFSLPPPPLKRRKSWSHSGEEISLYDEEAVTENILLDDFRGRSRYRPPSPPPIPYWWYLQNNTPQYNYQPLDQEDSASDDSGLTTIWIEVDMEQRRAQSLPPLPPRKDERYRRKKTNPCWRMFKHHPHHPLTIADSAALQRRPRSSSIPQHSCIHRSTRPAPSSMEDKRNDLVLRTATSLLAKFNLPLRRACLQPLPPPQPSTTKTKRGRKKKQVPKFVQIYEGLPGQLTLVAVNPITNPYFREESEGEESDPAMSAPSDQETIDLAGEEFVEFIQNYQAPPPPPPPSNALLLGAEQFQQRASSGVELTFDSECEWCKKGMEMLPHLYGNTTLASHKDDASSCPFYWALQEVINSQAQGGAAGPGAAEPLGGQPVVQEPQGQSVVPPRELGLWEMVLQDQEQDNLVDPCLAKLAEISRAKKLIEERKKKDREVNVFLRHVSEGIKGAQLLRVLLDAETGKLLPKHHEEYPSLVDGMTPAEFDDFVADAQHRKAELYRKCVEAGEDPNVGLDHPSHIPDILRDSLPDPRFSVLADGKDMMDFDAVLDEEFRRVKTNAARFLTSPRPKPRQIHAGQPGLFSFPAATGTPASRGLFVTYERPSETSYLSQGQIEAADLTQCFRISARSYRMLDRCLWRCFLEDDKLSTYNLVRPDSKRRFIVRLLGNLQQRLDAETVAEFASSPHRERNGWMIYQMASQYAIGIRKTPLDISGGATEGQQPEPQQPAQEEPQPARRYGLNGFDPNKPRAPPRYYY
ncbi:hypothetical protein TWF696_008608 [Orbilia brochopaga]|uniref:Uncharacterized protein n=1 Tax=Orbilia brochopaga TaxID=3140254 RepID=A0AAV9UHA5_9PEZI